MKVIFSKHVRICEVYNGVRRGEPGAFEPSKLGERPCPGLYKHRGGGVTDGIFGTSFNAVREKMRFAVFRLISSLLLILHK